LEAVASAEATTEAKLVRSPRLTPALDHRAAICALTALGRLSDDHPRLKLEIISIGKNTHVEIRIPQFDLRCLMI